MKFYKFEASWFAIRCSSCHLELENPPPIPYPNMWQTKPLTAPFPLLNFSKRRSQKLLDNHETGTNFNVYSPKLIALLSSAGVEYECFPTLITERDSVTVISEEHVVFHLLKGVKIFDQDRSQVSKRRIKQLVLDTDFERANIPMARDPSFKSFITVVSQELKDFLESEGVTGCEFTAIEDYRL